jgi:hypothetical protein
MTMTTSWTCNQLTYQLSDGTAATGTGQITQDETGGVVLCIHVPRGLTLSSFLEPQDVKGVTTSGEAVVAPECWPVTYREEAGTARATLAFSPSEVMSPTPNIKAHGTRTEPT